MLESLKAKVIASVIFVSVSGMIGSTYYLSSTLYELSDKTTKHSLSMLSESIFQTLVGSMLAGDSTVVKETLEKAGNIEGVESLNVAKSRNVIKVYAPDEKFTDDPVLEDKLQPQLIPQLQP